MTVLQLAPPCTLVYRTLTGPQFQHALSGKWNGPDQPVTPRWLASPRHLKYYYPRSSLVPGPDRRTLLLCLQAPESTELDGDESTGDELLMRAVGILELNVSPYEDNVQWLCYLTVEPAYQRQGIAKELLTRMVQHLKEAPQAWVLSRSRPSEEGRQKIKHYIDALLNQHGIAWTQSGD